jgi:hypothetical protein
MFLPLFQACKISAKLWKIKGLQGLTFRPKQKLWAQGSPFLFLFFWDIHP